MTTEARLHIFRAGTHIAQNGREVTLTGEDLAAMAGAYDPALHEAPLVIGHPANDAPAFGWVARLEADGQGLWAVARQVEPAFREAVNAGRYKKISVALYSPRHGSNPAPGKWHLRHVGFLGAQPPSVKGLASARFAAGDQADTLLELAFGGARELYDQASLWDTVAAMGRRLREWVISEKGVEQADQLAPAHELEGAQRMAASLRERASQEANAAPAFSEGGAGNDEEPKEGDVSKEREAQEAELAERERQVAEREQAVKAGEAAAAKAREAALQAGAEAFAEGLAEQGRLLPRDKAPVAALLLRLAGGEPAAVFAEGEGGGPEAPDACLKRLLARLPVEVPYGDEGGKPGPAAGVTDKGFKLGEKAVVDAQGLALHKEVLAYAERHGEPYEAALDKVLAAKGGDL